jgi:hypothetical protein
MFGYAKEKHVQSVFNTVFNEDKRLNYAIDIEMKRTNELVRVLQQILDKKTLSKNVNICLGGEMQEMTVERALRIIDP